MKMGETFTAFISLETLDGEHVNIPHVKARHVLFQLMYGRLIYSKGLQSDIPKF